MTAMWLPTPAIGWMQSLPKLLAEGGPVMLVLLVCSAAALAVCLERLIALRRRAVIPPDAAAAIATLQAPEQAEQIAQRFEHAKAPLARVVRCGLANRHLPRAANEEEMLMEGRQAAAVLERGLVVLEVVAAVAPLLGLLGTVLGMVAVFDDISAAGLGEAGRLSSGIKEALYTTVAGLSIGIPALAAYTYFRQKAETLSLEMERLSMMLLGKLYAVPRPTREAASDSAAAPSSEAPS